MVDVNKQISDLLSGISHVELANTEAQPNMPYITIECSQNVSTAIIKGKDYLSRIIYQIDCYAETPKEVNEMALQVNEKMTGAGFVRSNGKQFGRQRYMLTFKGIVDEKLRVYREE